MSDKILLSLILFSLMAPCRGMNPFVKKAGNKVAIAPKLPIHFKTTQSPKALTPNPSPEQSGNFNSKPLFDSSCSTVNSDAISLPGFDSSFDISKTDLAYKVPNNSLAEYPSVVNSKNDSETSKKFAIGSQRSFSDEDLYTTSSFYAKTTVPNVHRSDPRILAALTISSDLTFVDDENGKNNSKIPGALPKRSASDESVSGNKKKEKNNIASNSNNSLPSLNVSGTADVSLPSRTITLSDVKKEKTSQHNKSSSVGKKNIFSLFSSSDSTSSHQSMTTTNSSYGKPGNLSRSSYRRTRKREEIQKRFDFYEKNPELLKERQFYFENQQERESALAAYTKSMDVHMFSGQWYESLFACDCNGKQNYLMIKLTMPWMHLDGWLRFQENSDHIKKNIMNRIFEKGLFHEQHGLCALARALHIGCDPDSKHGGHTLLHIFAEPRMSVDGQPQFSKTMFHLLLKKGANPTLACGNVDPLHFDLTDPDKILLVKYINKRKGEHPKPDANS